MAKGLWIILLFTVFAFAEDDGYLETDKAIIKAFSGFGRALRSANPAELKINVDDMDETKTNVKNFVLSSPFLWLGFSFAGVALILFVLFIPLTFCCKDSCCCRSINKKEKKFCYPMLFWGILSVGLCAFCALAFASSSVMKTSFDDVNTSIDRLYATVDAKLKMNENQILIDNCNYIDSVITDYPNQLTYMDNLHTQYDPASFMSLEFSDTATSNPYLQDCADTGTPVPDPAKCYEETDATDNIVKNISTFNDELDDIAVSVTARQGSVETALDQSNPFYGKISDNSQQLSNFKVPFDTFCNSDQSLFVTEMTETFDTMKETVTSVTGDIDSRSTILVVFSIIIFCLPIIGVIGLLVGFFVRKRKFFLAVNWYILFAIVLLLVVGSVSFTLASSVGAACKYSDDEGAYVFVPNSAKDTFAACAEGKDLFSILSVDQLNTESLVKSLTLETTQLTIPDDDPDQYKLSHWSQEIYTKLQGHLADYGTSPNCEPVFDDENSIESCGDIDFKNAFGFVCSSKETVFSQGYLNARDKFLSTEQSLKNLPTELNTIHDSIIQSATLIEKAASCDDITLAADNVRDEICTPFINSFDALTFMSFLVSVLLILYLLNGLMLMKLFAKSSSLKDYDIEMSN